MFKWFKEHFCLNDYMKVVDKAIAQKQNIYPKGTKFETIEEIPYSKIILLPGALGVVIDYSVESILLRFYLNDNFAHDIYVSYELLKKCFKKV